MVSLPKLSMRLIEYTICLMYEFGHPPSSRPAGYLVAGAGRFETAGPYPVEGTGKRPWCRRKRCTKELWKWFAVLNSERGRLSELAGFRIAEEYQHIYQPAAMKWLLQSFVGFLRWQGLLSLETWLWLTVSGSQKTTKIQTQWLSPWRVMCLDYWSPQVLATGGANWDNAHLTTLLECLGM